MAAGCTNPAADNFNPSANPDDGSCIYLEKIGSTCYYFQDAPVDQTQEKSFTLSYSVDHDNWVFFHSYVPDFYFSTRNKLHTLHNDKVYTHNEGEVGKYYSSSPTSFFIDVVFATKDEAILNSLSWVTEVINRSTQISEEFSTLTHISIWNSWQHTSRIPLSSVFATLETSNTRKTQSKWNFDDFRDLVISRGSGFLASLFQDYAVDSTKISTSLPWYEKKLLEDNHFIVRLEFDNSADKDVILHSVDPNLDKSAR